MRIITLVFILTSFSNAAFSGTTKSIRADSSKPFVLGVIDEIESRQLNEKRMVNIYLPEGYNKDDTTRYPVVYLLDGSADEDFIHVVGLFQFDSFSWIKRVPRSIIVGIANTDRLRDFTYPTSIQDEKEHYPTSGHSDKFIAFIEKELQPFVEKKYKTSSTKTLIGESLGGLLATEILLKKPILFSKYIIVSPSLWWNDGSLLKLNSDLLQESFSQPTGIYIGVGKEGLTPTKIPHVMEVDANLLAEKIRNTKSKAVTVYFDYLPQEDHATVMHQAIYNALKLLYCEPVKP